MLDRLSPELHAAEPAGPALPARLAGEGVPEAEGLVARPGDDGLAGGTHGEEEDPAGVAGEGGGLLQRGVLPDGDFVVGVAVGAHDLPRVPRKHQVAHLRARVNAVQQRAVQRVPELYGLVGRPASRGQHAVVVRTPGQRLHRRAVGPEPADRPCAPRAPEEELVVVAARGEQAVVEGPLQPADLLRVALLAGDQAVRALPDVPHDHAAVPRPAGEDAVAPGHRADPGRVSPVLADPAAPGGVPELDGALAGADREVGARGVPVQAGDGVGGQLAELEDAVVGGVPEVEGGVERDGEDVEGGPLEQVEVEVVLQVGRVQHLEGNLADLALLGVRRLLLEPARDELLALAEGAALLPVGACEGEQLGGVAVEQQAAVHLVNGHPLLPDLPAAHRLLLLLFYREAPPALRGGVLAEGDEAVGGVPVVLLLFVEVCAVDAELRDQVGVAGVRVVRAGGGGGSVGALEGGGRGGGKGVFDVHKIKFAFGNFIRCQTQNRLNKIYYPAPKIIRRERQQQRRRMQRAAEEGFCTKGNQAAIKHNEIQVVGVVNDSF